MPLALAAAAASMGVAGEMTGWLPSGESTCPDTSFRGRDGCSWS